jgi:hypothetical protein
MNQEEAFEAAKLAAMVGGQLKSIDKHFIERKNIPANRIDINSFIDQVKDPIHHKTRMASYLANTPQGFAPPPPEDYIQSQVPDIQQVRPEVQPSITPPPTHVHAPAPTHVHAPAQESLPTLQTVTNIPQPIQQEKSSVSSKTEKEFLKTLKSIDKTLSDMLAYMKENLFR